MKTIFTATIFVMSFMYLNPSWVHAEANCSDESRFSEVSKQELSAWVEKKAVFVIDVNSSESFKTHHVPGAIHFASHEKDFAQVLPAKKDATIVAYCGGPMCDAWKKAAEAACKLGYTNVRHFKGGISGWVESKKKSG